MTSASRRSRAWETQAQAAAWFRDRGFPYATDAGAGRQGRDILNLIGLACEVKARKDFNPLAYVRQAQASAAGDLPFALLRCNGQGPAAIADWPVVLRLEDFTALLRAAGYGDPEHPSVDEYLGLLGGDVDLDVVQSGRDRDAGAVCVVGDVGEDSANTGAEACASRSDGLPADLEDAVDVLGAEVAGLDGRGHGRTLGGGLPPTEVGGW